MNIPVPSGIGAVLAIVVIVVAVLGLLGVVPASSTVVFARLLALGAARLC